MEEKGTVVYRGAFGHANEEWSIRNTIDGRFEIASITKAFTAIVVLQLVEEGRLSLKDTLAKVLPDYKGERADRITVAHLLTHTSGLQQDIGFADGDEAPPYLAEVNSDRLSVGEMTKLIAARPLRFEPGTQFGYSSDGYCVLGSVIEQVTGKDYYQAIRERIFDRAGMTDTVPAKLPQIVEKRVQGYRSDYGRVTNAEHIGASPAGGFYSTAQDLLKFEIALRESRLLNSASSKLVFSQRPVITAYGWKTAVERIGGEDLDVFRTTGGLPGFVNMLVRVPAKRRTIILLENRRGTAYYHEAITRAINDVMEGQAPVAPPKSLAEHVGAVYFARGEKVGLATYRDLHIKTHEYYASEPELNSLGYAVMWGMGAAQAVPLFEAIVEKFPQSWNAHDSLGEAYMNSGQDAKAIASFKASLALNPANTNAVEKLKRLSGG